MSGEAIGPLHGVPTAMKDLLRLQARMALDVRRRARARELHAGLQLLVGRARGGGRGDRARQDEQPGLRLQRRLRQLAVRPDRQPVRPRPQQRRVLRRQRRRVADGMVAFAEATDGGGSARIPAAWCGVVGFKQSLAGCRSVMRPNQFGPAPFMFEGLVARTVADIALGLTVLSGTDPRDPYAMLGAADFEGDGRRSVARHAGRVQRPTSGASRSTGASRRSSRTR